MDTFSITSNILSITLAVVSLVLSIYYYTQSNKVNRDSERIASDIKNSVNKLESLFEKLYSDTFTMLKEQNNTMQNAFLKNTQNVSNAASSYTDPKHTVIGKIVEHKKITIDSLCKQCNSINPKEVKSVITELQTEGVIIIQDDLIVFTVTAAKDESSSG